MTNTIEMIEALRAIAEGYPTRGEDDRYIVVMNPSFQEDDGSSPCLVIDTHNLVAMRPHDPLLRRLVEELRLWRMLVNEGSVPRYTITPGAALNTVVTSTDALLAAHHDQG